mgnify:FL=1
MKKIGFENDSVVPVSRGGLHSSWPHAPNESRQRECKIYPILRTGQADSMMKTYLESVMQQEYKRRASIAQRMAALAKSVE